MPNKISTGIFEIREEFLEAVIALNKGKLTDSQIGLVVGVSPAVVCGILKDVEGAYRAATRQTLAKGRFKSNKALVTHVKALRAKGAFLQVIADDCEVSLTTAFNAVKGKYDKYKE